MRLENHPFFKKEPIIPSVNDIILIGFIIGVTISPIPFYLFCKWIDIAEKIYPNFHYIYHLTLILIPLVMIRIILFLSSLLNNYFPKTSFPILSRKGKPIEGV